MGGLFARTTVTREDQRRLGVLGAFDYAVSHLRDAILTSQLDNPGRPFTVALEFQDEAGEIARELTGDLPAG